MEAFATPGVRDLLQDAVDAVVDESIDGFSTHALGEDLVDIRRSIDRLEAEFIRRLHRFHCVRGAQDDGGGSTVSCDAVRTLVTAAPPADGATLTAGSTSVTPLSVGRATRTIPAHIRTALNLRDQGCRFPGCDRPPAWTDGHHIIHWSDGGPTELSNLVNR